MKRKRITVDGEQVYRYRHQVETVLGRKLRESEHIHHIDGDPGNDEWINLALMSKGLHWWLTRIESSLNNITLFDDKGRPFHPTSIRFWEGDAMKLAMWDGNYKADWSKLLPATYQNDEVCPICGRPFKEEEPCPFEE